MASPFQQFEQMMIHSLVAALQIGVGIGATAGIPEVEPLYQVVHPFVAQRHEFFS